MWVYSGRAFEAEGTGSSKPYRGSLLHVFKKEKGSHSGLRRDKGRGKLREITSFKAWSVRLRTLIFTISEKKGTGIFSAVKWHNLSYVLKSN